MLHNLFSKFKSPYFLALLILSLSACAPKTEAESNQQAMALGSGPFFTGPNSLIAEQTVDLGNLVEGKTLDPKQIKEINLQAISIQLRENDSLDLSYFENASLSIVSANQDMMSIGTKNPIESDGQSVSLSVSEEANLADYFKDKNYSLVLDLEFKEDLYLDEVGATIDMKLIVKYKD